MLKRFLMISLSAAAVLCLCLALCSVSRAQQSAAQNQNSAPSVPWNSPSITPKQPYPASGPAPHRDISGIWDAFAAGIQPTGVKSHAPFTAWGEKMADSYKPGDGPRKVPLALINDPLDGCDPAGFPRDLFFELRPFKVVQTPDQVLILYEYQRVWRAIWTDGRELPKDSESRWYGYSVGRWEDDYTFVVDTAGTDERTWLDNAGDPHSDQLRVVERYHRLNQNTLELTVTLDDPKAYTKPWTPRDKLPLRLIPPGTDLMEMIPSATEAAAYKKSMAEPSK